MRSLEHSANVEKSVLRAVSLLYELEKPIWKNDLQSDREFDLHLDEIVLRADAETPPFATRIKPYAQRIKKQLLEISEFKNSDLSQSLMTRLLNEFGIETNDELNQSHFSLDVSLPLCFIVTYKGSNDLLLRAFRSNGVVIKPDARGLQFPGKPFFSQNDLLTNKVIMLFTEFMQGNGLNYADRQQVLKRVREHELRHLLDTLYRSNFSIKNKYDLLVYKSLLELGSAVQEGQLAGDYVMSHLESQKLFAFDNDPQTLAKEWQQKIDRVIDLFRLLRRQTNYDSNFMSLTVSVADSIEELESLLGKLVV